MTHAAPPYDRRRTSRVACWLAEVTTLSIFGFYFVGNLMSQMGWPRKQGIRKRLVYDELILGVAMAESVDWGAALGAGRPQLSLEMIGEIFRDSWDSDEPPSVKGFIELTANEDRWSSWSTAASPRDAVHAPDGTPGKSVSYEDFNAPKWRPLLEHYVFQALLWGLSYPDRFEAWYAASLEDWESMMPTYRQMGVHLDNELPPPLADFLAASEQIVRDYERDISSLPPIPPRLLDDATALGWKISD